MTFITSVLSETDSNNSTNTLLNNSENFIGIFTKTTGYNCIILTIKSDKDGDFQIIFSDDGINNSFTYNYTYYANQQYINNLEIIKKYYKVKFTNSSGSNQSTFSLYSRLTTQNNNDINLQEYNNQKVESNFDLDAFGKLRVTNPYSLIEIRIPPESTGTSEYLSNNVLICSKSTGSATASYLNSKCTLSVLSSGDRYINQSRKYSIYQPGKSLLFLASGLINAGSNDSSVTSRIGYFDDNNGLFFEYSNNILKVVLRNSTIDTVISQTLWNIDKMNGLGISSLNLDLTKTQLFVIDLEWLGVGRIRFGFYGNGIINYCHEIKNINVLTAPYIVSPNLPIRYEISSSGGSGSLIQICSTVISEGGYNPLGKPFSASCGISAVTISNVETPILAIKPIASYNHQNIIPTGISILDTNNNTLMLYKIRIFRSPSSDPGTFIWNNVNNNSLIKYSIGPTGVTLTNSIVVDEGYVYGGKGNILFNTLSDVFTSIFQITSDINNYSDIILITGQSLGPSTPNVLASITWQEVY